MAEEIIQIDDKYDDNDIQLYDEPRKPYDAHGGKKISSLSVSPNGTYVITYSSDDKSIEGWIVKDSNISLDPEAKVFTLPKVLIDKLAESENSIEIKVNDNKIVYYKYYSYFRIFQMSNEHRQIKFKTNLLEFFWKIMICEMLEKVYFKKNGDIVMVKINIFENSKLLLVYSFNEKDDELKLSSSHKLAGRIYVEEDNIWNIYSNCLSQFNSETESTYFLGFRPPFYDNIYEKSTIISKGNSIVVKHFNKIEIFSKGKSDPVQNIRIRNSIIKVEFLYDDYLLVFNLPKLEDKCQKIILYHTSDINKQPVDVSKVFNNNCGNNFILYEYNSESKKAFGLVDERIKCIDLSSRDLRKTFDDDIIAGWNTYLDDFDLKKFQFDETKDKKINVIEDDTILARYGADLFPILVNSNNPKLICHIESIYTKCMKLVKEDPNRNLKFLNIITSSMNDLYKKYPDYITKFNSEMFMFLDPSNENIISNKNYYHFRTFSVDCVYFLLFITFMLNISIVGLFTFIAWFITDLYMLIYESISAKRKANQYIVLIVPYINYSRYPLKYSWRKEVLYPQQSEFVKTCEKIFYTNWNGEAVINHKWECFGRDYYFGIWLMFTIFLICFTIASYPTNSISQETRSILYQTSIAFGVFHLIFELRQFIWNPRKYFFSKWNWFDLSAFLSVTITSIYWINYDVPYWALSVSCLLLDLKFLLFFRAFESFGVYFAIIFGVAKRVFSFLILLAIIIASFAHAFFLLLHPQNLLDSLNTQNSNDPDNPWTLSNTYDQVDENGNVLNETLIQVPDENKNLFYSYPTSLLAIYLFLTGNQNSLSSWTPTPSIENTILFILMVIFSFLIVIYLMNLFIGLLNLAMEEDNDRASYLVQKAEIIAEIELFYLLPHERRLRHMIPEVIYYAVDITKARKYIREAINKGDWKKDDWPKMQNKILKLLNIEDAIKD
ncbi:hypothetical protein C1645_870767 [Glomus cerebriforme]|uniref:Ion transport domain-containing protein n=1 Tax=Glomus cerebriforme TaxID=658196 RepID=A0A397TP61_9GLOM|nr:hypothetical protein C1645_870767 [Glomus cerebriforme]